MEPRDPWLHNLHLASWAWWLIMSHQGLRFKRSLRWWEVDRRRGQKSWRLNGFVSVAEEAVRAGRAGRASWRRAELAIIIRQGQKLQPYLWDGSLSCFSSIRDKTASHGWFDSLSFHTHRVKSSGRVCRPTCARAASSPSAIGQLYYGCLFSLLPLNVRESCCRVCSSGLRWTVSRPSAQLTLTPRRTMLQRAQEKRKNVLTSCRDTCRLNNI